MRERKKQRTKQALIDAALRLFRERGYDQTTIADITEAADVSPRTFFLHFPAKEDVLFADNDLRIDAIRPAIKANASPGTPAREVLARTMKQMVTSIWEADLSSGAGALRLHLLPTTPALQAALLRRLLTSLRELTTATCEAFPQELDRITAATLAGALAGAVIAAALASLEEGQTPAQTRDAMNRAIAMTTGEPTAFADPHR